MFRNIGIINKLRMPARRMNFSGWNVPHRNFSARMKLSQLQRSNRELFGVAEGTSGMANPTGVDPSQAAQETGLTASETQKTENNDYASRYLSDSETEDPKIQNYVDQEQALKDNMQMINYKSNLPL